MARTTVSSFGALLRRLRTESDLTQEELAERAQLSTRGVSDLERGINTKPRRFTLSQLADALHLDPVNRARFERAAAVATLDADSKKEDLPHGNFLGAIPESRLISREDELGRIGSILDSVTEGAGHLLLLGGARGAGKTRLLQEMTLGARTRGYVVLTASCYPSEQSIAFQPLLEALSSLTAKVPTEARTEAERGWKAIKQQAEETARDRDDNGWTSRRMQLTATTSDTLLQASQAAPVALILDDLQWADAESLRVVQYLSRVARASRILLAGTFCDVHLAEAHPKLSGILKQLTHDRLAECITVRRLSPEETTTLLASLMGQDEVSEEFAAFVYRRTKGSPRLIEAMAWSLGGRLELHGEIGSGSTGRVFRAFDRRTDMVVAAKLVLAREGIEVEDLLRFQQEGTILAALHHPNIVHVYDTFAEEHAACIIMELLDGRSLAQVLQDGPIALPQAKSIAVQVASALAYAHSQSIVHRDIKPDNVMVLAENEIKVTDFGIARILRTDNSLATMATTGMRAGTPSYMAPEQIAGKEIDGRSDVYALGAMLFHMVAGRPPFEGPDKLSIAVKHLQEQSVPPSSINPDVPSDWDALILKALQKEPGKRFRSAQSMEQAIGELGDTSPSRSGRKVPLILSIFAAGLVAAALVAAVVIWRHPVSTAQASAATKIKTYLSRLTADGQLSGTVLVAKRGKVLVNQGYGLADRRLHIVNGANTRYVVGGLTPILASVDYQRFIDTGLLRSGDPICRYLPHCLAAWRPITVQMLLDGTSNLPDYGGFGTTGNSVAQSLAGCQSIPLDGRPGSAIDYQNCDDLVLSLISQKVFGLPWAKTGIFAYPGMKNSGQMLDAIRSPDRAVDYNGPQADPGSAYNDSFTAYSTAPDILAFDNDLFAGRIVLPGDVKRELHPRTPLLTPDPAVKDASWGYYWKVGTLFGRRVAYSIDSADDFQDVNVRFLKTGVTIIVLSNNILNNVWGISLRAAGMIFDEPMQQSPRLGTPPPALLGKYRRIFRNQDRLAAHDPGLQNWVGAPQTITFRGHAVDYNFSSVDELFTAGTNGSLAFLGYSATNQSSFCGHNPTEASPTGYYRWSRSGNKLTIKKISDSHCPDRASLMPGIWTKIS